MDAKEAIYQELCDRLSEFTAILTAQEVIVLLLRSGAVGGKIYFCREIAEIFGVSENRVRNVERRGLSKIIRIQRQKSLSPF